MHGRVLCSLRHGVIRSFRMLKNLEWAQQYAHMLYIGAKQMRPTSGEKNVRNVLEGHVPCAYVRSSFFHELADPGKPPRAQHHALVVWPW